MYYKKVFDYYDNKVIFNPINLGVSFIGKVSPYLVKKITFFNKEGLITATKEFNYDYDHNGLVTKTHFVNYTGNSIHKVLEYEISYTYSE